MHVLIKRPVEVADGGKPRQYMPGPDIVEVSDDTGHRLLRSMAAVRAPAPAKAPDPAPTAEPAKPKARKRATRKRTAAE
jgi:hypothetical protein